MRFMALHAASPDGRSIHEQVARATSALAPARRVHVENIIEAERNCEQNQLPALIAVSENGKAMPHLKFFANPTDLSRAISASNFHLLTTYKSEWSGTY